MKKEILMLALGAIMLASCEKEVVKKEVIDEEVFEPSVSLVDNHIAFNTIEDY